MSGALTIKPALAARDQKNLNILDSQYNRIFGAGIPTEPYLVYVDDPPKPYHCRPDVTGIPFSPDEWHLQYQTFLYREFPDTILRLRAGREPEHLKTHNNPLKRIGAGIASGRPTKKISLSQYKSRKAGMQGSTVGGTAGAEASQPSKENAGLTSVPQSSDTDRSSGPVLAHQQTSDESELSDGPDIEAPTGSGKTNPKIDSKIVDASSSRGVQLRIDAAEVEDALTQESMTELPPKRMPSLSNLDQHEGPRHSAKKDSPLEGSSAAMRDGDGHGDPATGTTRRRNKAESGVSTAEKAETFCCSLPLIHVSPVLDNPSKSETISPFKAAKPLDRVESITTLPVKAAGFLGMPTSSFPTFTFPDAREKAKVPSQPSSPQTVGPYQLSESPGSSVISVGPSPESLLARTKNNAASPMKSNDASSKAAEKPPILELPSSGLVKKTASSPVEAAAAHHPLKEATAPAKRGPGAAPVALTSHPESTAKSRPQNKQPALAASSEKQQEQPTSRLADSRPQSNETEKPKAPIVRERKVVAAPSSFFAAMTGSSRGKISRPVTPASNPVKVTATTAATTFPSLSSTKMAKISPASSSPEEESTKVVKLKYSKSSSSRVQQLLRLPQPRLRTATPVPHEQQPTDRTVSDARNATLTSTKRPTAGIAVALAQGSSTSPKVANCGVTTSASPEFDIEPGDPISQAHTWAEEYDQQRKVGTLLKRQMITTANAQDATTRRSAVVLGVESILCWIQAFTARDQCKLGPDASTRDWGSVVALAREVGLRCKAVDPHIFGMASFLRSTIDSVILKHLSQIDSPDEQQTHAWRETYQRSIRTMAQCKENLPLNTLATDYQEATIESSKIALGGTADPMVAARIGRKFLEAWTDKQGIKWTPRMVEGMCARL